MKFWCAAAVEVGPSDRAVGVRPVDVRVVDRHPLGVDDADEARVDPAAVEVGAPDRVGVEVGPVDVAAVDRQSVDLDLGPDADKTRVRGRAVEIGARDRPEVIRPVDEPIGARGEREGRDGEGGEDERGAHEGRATARGRRRRHAVRPSPSRVRCVHEGPFSRRPKGPGRAFGWWRQPRTGFKSCQGRRYTRLDLASRRHLRVWCSFCLPAKHQAPLRPSRPAPASDCHEEGPPLVTPSAVLINHEARRRPASHVARWI